MTWASQTPRDAALACCADMLAGACLLSYLLLFLVSCCPVQLLLRQYTIKFKKSGTRIPRVALTEMGPSLDLSVRRHRLAPPDMEKEALRKPQLGKKKVGYTDTVPVLPCYTSCALPVGIMSRSRAVHMGCVHTDLFVLTTCSTQHRLDTLCFGRASYWPACSRALTCWPRASVMQQQMD